MEETRFFDELDIPYNQKRLADIAHNKFLKEEIETITNLKLGIEYYRYIYHNTSLDESNTQNSYIMWILEKVSNIDKNQPTTFIPGHTSLPDIDMDVPIRHRDEIIEYIKDTYGHERVSQVITFGRLRGKSALKEILRTYEVCGFGEMNEITKYIPDEGVISDQLQQMDEEDRSIIKWSLIHNDKELMDYCYIDSNGNLAGEYAEYFQKAIDIEGTFKSHGTHAAGIVISRDILSKICPILVDKDGNSKAAFEMSDLDDTGQVKFDVLGLANIDRRMSMKKRIKERYGVCLNEILSSR